MSAHSATAEISSTDDYLAISVEAEDFESSEINVDNDDDRWALTDPATPQTLDDPDDNNSGGAVGEKYLELLPDIRVTHEDPFSPPTAFWGNPGAGPTLKYDVDFPEPGRYYLHVRLNSSGTEDNGVHAGLNEDWPDSAARVQSCTAGQGWAWTSRQRGSGDIQHCGVKNTLWVDVPEAGVNTVKFSGREDGFEFDRFVLIKDKSDNTRICSPVNELEIGCINGSLESADEVADVAIYLEVDRTTGVEQDLYTFNASVANEDAFDVANQVVMETTLDLIDTWELISASDVCIVSGQLIQCSAGDLEPTTPGEELNIEFTLRAMVEGDHVVGVDVTTTSQDEDPTNDISSVEVSVVPQINYATLVSTISRDKEHPTVAESTQLTVAVENTSGTTSDNTTVTIILAAGLYISDADPRCSSGASDQLVCNIGSLEANTSQSFTIDVQADTPQFYPVTFRFGADNLEEGSFSSTYVVEVVEVEDSVEENESDQETEQPVAGTDIPTTTDNPESESLPEEKEGNAVPEGDAVTEEVVQVAQTSSGGGAVLWMLLMLASYFGWVCRLQLASIINTTDASQPVIFSREGQAPRSLSHQH